LRRPPRDPRIPLLVPRRIAWAIVQGLIAFAIVAAVLVGAARMGIEESVLRALVFTSLVLVNVGLILVNRSYESSVFRAIRQPNRALWILMGAARQSG
jgi:Ca2+-transporting ATPase